MRYLLLIFTITFQGQTVHHHMLSAQGTSTQMTNGLLVTQTVGQQSIIGTSSAKDYVVIQGFQQSLWGKYIASNPIRTLQDLVITTYPNPFVTVVHFQFSKPSAELVTVSIFDVLGRLVYEQKKKVENSILTIDLARFPVSEYLVRLNGTNLNYYTKILKQND